MALHLAGEQQQQQQAAVQGFRYEKRASMTAQFGSKLTVLRLMINMYSPSVIAERRE